MPDKLHRCVLQVMSDDPSLEKAAAYAICSDAIRDGKHNEYIGHFSDAMTFAPEEKTAISVRDGVLKYYGSELGMEPAAKMFTVYRSPATIANAATKMPGVMLTNDHVSLDRDVISSSGCVESAEMIDMVDEATGSRLAVLNRISITDEMQIELANGKRELSLGYRARLIPHEAYDFEQLDIQPHHLAVVNAGRCGSSCSFIDKAPEESTTMNNAFLDADGAMCLQQIVEIMNDLPNAIRLVPIDKINEIMPKLQELVAMARAIENSLETDSMTDEATKAEAAPVVVEAADQAPVIPVTDTQEFKDAVAAALNDHTAVIEKAKDFMDESYSFSGKSTAQIMRDALAVEHESSEFTDAELPVAFKLLRKSASNLQNFGDADASSGKFNQLKDKEL